MAKNSITLVLSCLLFNWHCERADGAKHLQDTNWAIAFPKLSGRLHVPSRQQASFYQGYQTLPQSHCKRAVGQASYLLDAYTLQGGHFERIFGWSHSCMTFNKYWKTTRHSIQTFRKESKTLRSPSFVRFKCCMFFFAKRLSRPLLL